MPKTIKEARANLAKAIVHAKIAKQIIGFITREGRMRLTEDEVHSLKDLTLILGNDVATTDSFLGEYSREDFNSMKFSVTGRKVFEKTAEIK